ncbi:hypothetical protein GDO81_008453 [Engystomops pustulosus]|uniref:Uncharacterized protein n=2 Tax=Engystomops pustulosus TaxID=76066 RepID=A0AAV7CFF6_ENGPU|nr:hypothetical protein GDO81_008453 [Engystomops pustulosus]
MIRSNAQDGFISPTATGIIELIEQIDQSSLEGKNVLIVGADASLEAPLQCLLQRKGAVSLVSPWQSQQLQNKVERWRTAAAALLSHHVSPCLLLECISWFIETFVLVGLILKECM